ALQCRFVAGRARSARHVPFKLYLGEPTMKTRMISFVALALLVSGCIGEHGLEQGAEEGYGAGDEQLVGEEPTGEEPASDSAPSPGVPGGPSRHVMKGSRTIVCAGIQWPNRNQPAATTSACNNLSHDLADYYHRNSRGLFTLVPVA